MIRKADLQDASSLPDVDADDPGDRKYPVCYTRNTAMAATVVFTTTAALSGNLRIKGMGPDNPTFPSTMATINGQDADARITCDHSFLDEAAAKAAKTLDDLRARQRARSDKVLDDVLNYTPLLWPRALDQRIMLASKLGDMDAVRECLLELRDKVPASAERDRSLGRNQALAKYHGVILSATE